MVATDVVGREQELTYSLGWALVIHHVEDYEIGRLQEHFPQIPAHGAESGDHMIYTLGPRHRTRRAAPERGPVQIRTTLGCARPAPHLPNTERRTRGRQGPQG